jgi:2-methylcitrate dehydratase PrpD
MTSLARELARWARARFDEPLPGGIARKVQLHILDATSIAMAARVEEIGEQILRAATISGGEGPARVLGGIGGKPTSGLAPTAAAFANAGLIHALDFDDIHDGARLHPTTVVLPAVLAVADLIGSDDSERLSRAVAVGSEVMCRMGELTEPAGTGAGSGWFLTQLYGYVGASIAAGLMLFLNEDELVSAIGVATMQAAGARQAAYGAGSTARSVYPAFAAEGGVRAALLAREGFVGPEEGLEGEAGLFPLYLGHQLDADQTRRLVDDSSAWSFLATDVKRWPCCRLSHTYVAAAIDLRAQLGDSRPERIIIDVDRSANRLCQPAGARRRPSTLVDAKYSIPFMVAFALERGAPTLDSLTVDVLKNLEILATADRIEVRETGSDNAGHPEAVVTVESEGRTLTSSIDTLVPMSESAIRDKIALCVARALENTRDLIENGPVPLT